MVYDTIWGLSLLHKNSLPLWNYLFSCVLQLMIAYGSIGAHGSQFSGSIALESSQLWRSFHREANYAKPQIRQWMRPTHATWPNPSHPHTLYYPSFQSVATVFTKTWPIQHLSPCPNQRVKWKAAFDIHLAPFKFPVMPFGLNNTPTLFQFYLNCFVYNSSVTSSKNPSEQVLY